MDRARNRIRDLRDDLRDFSEHAQNELTLIENFVAENLMNVENNNNNNNSVINAQPMLENINNPFGGGKRKSKRNNRKNRKTLNRRRRGGQIIGFNNRAEPIYYK